MSIINKGAPRGAGTELYRLFFLANEKLYVLLVTIKTVLLTYLRYFDPLVLSFFYSVCFSLF